MEARPRLFFPPRILRPEPAELPAAPRPVPRQTEKDRISIGPTSSLQAQGPLILRREDDLTAVPKGEVGATGKPGPSLSPEPASVPTRAASGSGPTQPSIAASLRRLEQGGLGAVGVPGQPSGTGQQIGPLFFDPEGADFTTWTQHFKNDVYRNWVLPQSVWMGAGGEVVLEFTVERDGRIRDVRLLKSAGMSSLDGAARNALLGSRFLPLPADFHPSSVTIQASFLYGERRQGS